MKFRKLRVAFSLTTGLLTVLSLVLWKRSYVSVDSITHRGKNTLGIVSRSGSLCFAKVSGAVGTGWSFGSERLRNIESNLLPHDSFELRSVGSGMWVAFFPHWILAGLSGTASLLALLPWSTRYGLRALLISTTLIAAGLGLVVWLIRSGQ